MLHRFSALLRLSVRQLAIQVAVHLAVMPEVATVTVPVMALVIAVMELTVHVQVCNCWNMKSCLF